MAQMKKIRSDMEFMIVTDDVTMAHKLYQVFRHIIFRCTGIM